MKKVSNDVSLSNDVQIIQCKILLWNILQCPTDNYKTFFEQYNSNRKILPILLYIHRFGPRFPAMSEAYDQKLRRLGLDVADQMGMQIREGVYVMQSGPCYESVTECRLLSLLGADVTGEETINILGEYNKFGYKENQL